jgi:LuxR family maltose regulon positive regulatory protein
LERLSGALCDAVTELLDSQARLEALHRTNLFTIALDEHGEWYRYHHLFRDALRLRLQQTQPDLIPTLHQRASIWYESAGLLDEAIDHAIAAADLQRAGDLIVNAFLGLWKRGELGVLRRWIENLPAVALDTDPALAFWAGTLFCYTGQLDLAERRLDRAEAHFRAAQAVEPDSMDQRLGRVAVLQGMLAARRGLVTEAFARAEQAFALLPADDLVFRGGVYPLLGLAHLIRGDLIAAQQAYEQAAEVARHIDHWFLLTGALGRLVPVQLALGRLHAAAATCRQVLALPIVQSGGVPAAGYAHVGLAEVYYQWNDLTTAADHATTGVALGETSSIADLLYNAVLTCAKVQGALGARAEALAMIQRGHELAPQVGGAHLARRVQAMEALVQLRLGQVAAAAHLAHLRTATEAPDPLVAEFERLVEARWRLATGEPAGAVAILQPLLPAAETAQRQGSMIEILALLARAQAAHNEAATAVATLTRALTLAEPEGYIRLFVDEGPALADLLRAVGRQGSAAPLRPYLGRLLTAFADPPLEQAKVPGPGVAQSLTPDTALIEPLSEREQEVLQLVAEGASNEQIATALVISIHTVRKHMSNILGKLDVTSRTEAVAHARRLGLL